MSETLQQRIERTKRIDAELEAHAALAKAEDIVFALWNSVEGVVLSARYDTALRSIRKAIRCLLENYKLIDAQL